MEYTDRGLGRGLEGLAGWRCAFGFEECIHEINEPVL
jgi:hypothetical protein